MSVNVYSNNSSSKLAMSKEMKKKFTKTFDLSQIAEDPMDCYLDTLGLWKKRIARDGSCLFRAVAEQIYPCQLHHEKVRKECIKYMSDHRDIYSKFLTTISFEDYLESMKNPYEYAGQLEIAAMSKLYRRDFIVYHHPDQSGLDVTQNGFEKKIYLCYSYNNHFDAIFTKSHRDNLALIQSLVYEILYDKVFGSGEQVSVARRLLRKSDTIYPKEYMSIRNLTDYGSSLGYDDEDEDDDEENEDDDDVESEILNEVNDNSIEEIDDDTLASVKTDDEIDNSKVSPKTDENNNESTIDIKYLSNNILDEKFVEESVQKPKTSVLDESKTSKTSKLDTSLTNLEKNNSQVQKMPLPYKVAKSLDPVIYRNTAFDAWLAAKKEYEEVLNQKAISTMQSGDRCLVKLNNNYSEKWNSAYLHSIQNDLANVFVIELNENACIPVENLKPYSNTNDGTHHNNGHHYGNNHHNIFNQNSIININNVKNVQKLVQSINSQFSKIFISTESKRRNLKKKQCPVKKSISFHELPTVHEAEEFDETFGYNTYSYYSNDPHNMHFNSINSGNSTVQNNYHHNHMNSFHLHPRHHNHPQQQPLSQGSNYYSLPHTSSNFSSETKQNTMHGTKLTSSTSASNINQNLMSFNNAANKNNNVSAVQPVSNSSLNKINNLNSSSSIQNNKGQRRNQRFSLQQNSINSFESNNNSFGFNTNKLQHQAWPNNFTNNQINSYMNTPQGPNHHLPHIQPPLLSNQPFMSHSNSFTSGMGLPPLNSQGNFMPPIQPLNSHQHSGSMPLPPPPSLQFMHGPPPLPPPLSQQLAPLPNSSNQQRQNFFNPNTNYMFPPPASTLPPPMNSHITNGENNYYFPSATSQCNSANQNYNNNNTNKSFQHNNHRKSGENFPNNKSTSNIYQQSNGNSLTSDVQQSSGFHANTSNYLLMPAPNNNKINNKNVNHAPTANPAVNKSGPNSLLKPDSTSVFDNSLSISNSNSLSRSHSYHSGVTTQSYDLNNNSNVYVDVYIPPPPQPPPQQQQQLHLPHAVNTHGNQSGSVQQDLSNLTVHQASSGLVMNSNNNNNNNNINNNNISSSLGNNSSSSCLNDLNSLVNNSNGTSFQYPSINTNNNTNVGLDNSIMNYNSSSFQNYEMQYPRFDNNGLMEDSFLLNPSESRQNNAWNKGNKLTKSTSMLSDLTYSASTTASISSNLPANQTDKNNQHFCYSNCLVVNIDGPINFNATHSLLDDGSDLPINDVNTIRFFYNVGIEYYRLNLATPYNQSNSYSTTTCYGPPPPQIQVSSISNFVPSNISSSSSSLPLSNSLTNNSLLTQAPSSTTLNMPCTNSMPNANSNNIQTNKPVKTELTSTCTLTKDQQIVENQQVTKNAKHSTTLTSSQQSSNRRVY